MNNRTLIKENTELANEIKSDLTQFKTPLSHLKRAYESMEIGGFSQEVFKKLILTGTKDTVAFYITNLNSQLDKLGITSKTMRENTIAGHDHIIETLNNSVSTAKGFRPTIYSARPVLSIKFISFIEGVFVVSDEDYEAVLENFCRTYIEAEELPILEIAQDLQTLYNKFLDVVDQQKIISGSRLNCLILILSEDNTGKVVVDAGKLKGLITYKQRYAEFNSLNLR